MSNLTSVLIFDDSDSRIKNFIEAFEEMENINLFSIDQEWTAENLIINKYDYGNKEYQEIKNEAPSPDLIIFHNGSEQFLDDYFEDGKIKKNDRLIFVRFTGGRLLEDTNVENNIFWLYENKINKDDAKSFVNWAVHVKNGGNIKNSHFHPAIILPPIFLPTLKAIFVLCTGYLFIKAKSYYDKESEGYDEETVEFLKSFHDEQFCKSIRTNNLPGQIDSPYWWDVFGIYEFDDNGKNSSEKWTKAHKKINEDLERLNEDKINNLKDSLEKLLNFLQPKKTKEPSNDPVIEINTVITLHKELCEIMK